MTSSNSLIARICLTLLLAVSPILWAGCASTKPASAAFASVIIHYQTEAKICGTTAEVFQADGYQVVALSPKGMQFEKEGTRGQSLAYGGLVSTHDGARILVRVRAELVDLGVGAQRLQCQAFMVTDAGDSFFEDENRLLTRKGKPYQKLLNQVADRLK